MAKIIRRAIPIGAIGEFITPPCPEEKRGLLVVTGAKKSEDWMNTGMRRRHSQSPCSLIRAKGRVGRDPLHPLCLKKSSLHLGSRTLAFDASCAANFGLKVVAASLHINKITI